MQFLFEDKANVIFTEAQFHLFAIQIDISYNVSNALRRAIEAASFFIILIYVDVYDE